jgi:hypothetical protein
MKRQTRTGREWFVLVSLFLAIASSGQTPGPASGATPLTPTNDVELIRNGAGITPSSAGPYLIGQFHFMADPSFNTGALATVDTSVEVLYEEVFDDGRRQIIAIASDSAVDRILAILRRDSRVWGVSRTYLTTRGSSPNDPYWGKQEGSGMWLMRFPNA